MIPVRGYDGHRVGVLGLGRSGFATALSLSAGGATPVCWDDNEAARAKAEAEGYEVSDMRRSDAWDGIAALITSPGIPHLYPEPHPVIAQAQAQGVVVDNDIGLFFRSYATEDWDQFDQMPQVVAVTGSNGKSTTSALIEHILSHVGRDVQLGGNIGRSALDLDPAIENEVVVLELSSYQTELARALAPDIGVFLNLSPDHLDRHGGIGGYFAAKRRLFVEGVPDKLIVGVDEVEGRFLASQMREVTSTGEPVIQISAGQKLQDAGWSVFARRGFLAEWRRGRQVASFDLRGIANLPGAHNHQNACAAYAVCRALGLAPKVIEAAMASYPGLPHRAQLLGSVNGVSFVNDSKATNAEAAGKSLSAFKNIRWIAGGEPKEGGILELWELFGNVKKSYLIGDAAAEFANTLSGEPHEISGTLETAVKAAFKDAKEGDTILLAPACASFDQFKSFEHRGEAFAALVAELLG